MIRRDHPEFRSLHTFSDVPISQYHHKGNFFNLTTKPFDFGFDSIIWHFFEAGQCKGAQEGTGGSLKSTADHQIKLGKDIPTAEMLCSTLERMQSSIKLSCIRQEEVLADTSNFNSLEIPPIKGTMELHEIVSVSQGAIHYRDSLFLTCGDFNCHHASWLCGHLSHLRKISATHWDWQTLSTSWPGSQPTVHPLFWIWFWPMSLLMSAVLPLLQSVHPTICLSK